MWIALAVFSAISLGIYDFFKKISVTNNNVPIVLMWNTVICALLLSPVIVNDISCSDRLPLDGSLTAHTLVLLKSIIVLSSWSLGYFSLKHLPLTITGPINASRPVIVLVGALIIFQEHLNFMQWTGVILGFVSLFFISRLGHKESSEPHSNKWILFALGGTLCGAIAALYDKYLLSFMSPLDVQAYYSLYQALIMVTIISLIRVFNPGKIAETHFQWRWSIVAVAVFLTLADMAYFKALTDNNAMISIMSMIRRGSVIVSFVFGIVILHEQHFRAKLFDIIILLIGLTLIVLGSNQQQ